LRNSSAADTLSVIILSIQLIVNHTDTMRWQGRRQSSNVEDRRSVSGRGLAVGGGIGSILIVLISYFLGVDPSSLQIDTQTAPQTEQFSQADQERAKFVSVVLADTEDVWNTLFRQQNLGNYREPKLVLFSSRVSSACGMAGAATGPFYCPADQKVYIDLSFQDQLSNRFGASGDFAMAYVVAHEVGHHIQTLLGISQRVHQMRGQLSEAEYNQLSVRLELQADFLAGVWAHHAHNMKNILEEGDIEEALTAANAIGDDRLQQQSQGYVVPDAFTHGTSEQRMRWFKKGYQTGDVNQGDTFSADRL
jgi:uncharacterized protein